MTEAKRVTATLLRRYRPIVLWFLAVITVAVVVVEIVMGIADDFASVGGVWALIATSATRYWMFVIGVLLTTAHLRPYVANGITRRDFARGATAFGLLMAVVLAVVVLIGNLVESGLTGGDTGAGTVERFRPILPGLLAYGVSGWLIGTGYYRFNPYLGTLLIAPAVVPMLLTTWLLGAEDHGPFSDAPLPFAAGLAVVLAVVALAYLVVRRLVADVPIRRTATA